MGANYCVQYCEKSEKDQNPETEEKRTINNQFSSNGDSVPQHNYNHFAKKFNSKLHYLGKYFDISKFKQIIPKNANTYMIQNVLSIPENITPKKNTYEMKPVQFQNGNIYSGNWSEKFRMEGYGQYYIKEVNLFVEGIWENGKLVYGRIFFPNENIYEGEIKNSSFMGKGKLIFNNGEIYIGDFNDGERTGKGKYIFNDGTVYEGDMVNGEFKGHGIMKWTKGVEYEGNFNGLILSGKGKLIDINSNDIYKGNFENNYFNGNGIYKFGDKSSYEGEFEFGLKNGKGIYKNKDGLIYEGEWRNNLPDGVGKLQYDDYIVKGIWKNGNNVEITDFIKGSIYDFDKKCLNFEIPSFNLCPQLLSNLIHQEISDIKKYEGGFEEDFFD